jgi:hypothetical protein
MLPCFHVTSSIQAGLVARDGSSSAVMKSKNLETGPFGLHLYCNPLKSHKTAKGFFGKAWRKQAEIWKCLEKTLEVGRRAPGGARFAVHEAQCGLAKP